MPNNFQAAVNRLLKDEGGAYVADDNGRGPSKWGITWKTAETYGFLSSPDQVKDLTREQAALFYNQHFWDVMGLQLIESLPLASRLLNLGVNIGPTTTIVWLQQCVNHHSIRIVVDGLLGPKTAKAANALDPASLLACVKEKAELYYRRLVETNPAKYADDLQGWLNRLREADV